MATDKLQCKKCGKVMGAVQFYTLKTGEKMDMCKKCLTMHVDSFNPDTYLWIIEKLDLPYVEEEWNKSRDDYYAKDPTKFNHGTVVGKYISKMKLIQWRKYGWADTEKLKAEHDAAATHQKEEMEQLSAETKAKYEAGEITEAEYKTLTETREQYENRDLNAAAMAASHNVSPAVVGGFYDESQFLPEESLSDPAADLTDEDKIFLALKWGRYYKPSEWVTLEDNYQKMMASFDIQDADSISTLILICKTSLKMNQAIDGGDVDGFQKLSRVYESLRKSAKFTAAQKKEKETDFVDSCGELVAMCEREQGFIPRFATDIPQDKIDMTLKDMNNYVQKLVTQDLGFGQQIENAIKQIQNQLEMEKEETPDIEDDDVAKYYEDLENQKQEDLEAKGEL